jgi:hypothetical protein
MLKNEVVVIRCVLLGLQRLDLKEDGSRRLVEEWLIPSLECLLPGDRRDLASSVNRAIASCWTGGEGLRSVNSFANVGDE